MLAYLDQNGAVWTVDVASGDVQQVFEATFEPGRPTWSKDGNVIALAAVKPYSRRYREGLSKILVVNRRTGEATYVDPAPDRVAADARRRRAGVVAGRDDVRLRDGERALGHAGRR